MCATYQNGTRQSQRDRTTITLTRKERTALLAAARRDTALASIAMKVLTPPRR